jgi:Fur family ferric uptake transcriptional regulator
MERLCVENGLRLNAQRRAILNILDTCDGHPSAEDVYWQAKEAMPRISATTVYRLLNALADAGLLHRLELGDGRSRFEKAGKTRHEHLIDVRSGTVVEFRSEAIALLLAQAAARLGYRLLDYRLELFGDSAPPETGSIAPTRRRSGRGQQRGSALGLRQDPALTRRGETPARAALPAGNDVSAAPQG